MRHWIHDGAIHIEDIEWTSELDLLLVFWRDDELVWDRLDQSVRPEEYHETVIYHIDGERFRVRGVT
jgi:hypothetical protein